jgi:hypothetical protein
MAAEWADEKIGVRSFLLFGLIVEARRSPLAK